MEAVQEADPVGRPDLKGSLSVLTTSCSYGSDDSLRGSRKPTFQSRDPRVPVVAVVSTPCGQSMGHALTYSSL